MAFRLRPIGVALALAVVLPVASACRSGHGRVGPLADRPDVLLIVVDTLRADHLPTYGYGRRTAPHLQAFARESVVFDAAVSAAPFTMPAVAALMTGRYPDRVGVINHSPRDRLIGPTATLAERAAAAGYQTAAVVANPWLAKAAMGFSRGFARYDARQKRGSLRATATEVSDSAIRMLSQSDSGPLFLWVHYIDVHMPYRPPARFVHELGLKRESTKIVEDYSRGRNDLRQSIYFEAPYSEREIQATVDLYDAAIRYVDFELGRLLESWRERRHAGGAVVVITADHGESLGEHGLHFAHDFTLYDELLRVPLIVRADGLPARRIGSLVSLTDVMPSLCRLMRLECDEEDFDGRPLPLGSDDAASDRRVFAASAPARKRYDRCPWLTVPGPEGRWTMLRTADRKLIRIPQPDGERLLTFDLRADPFERSALKQTDPSLREELLAWQKALREQAPERLPPAQLGARTREALRGLGYLN